MSIVTAIGFLTAIPMPGRAPRPGDLGRAAIWFPAVGAIIGAALAGVDWVGRSLWSPEVAAALLLGVTLLLTGGLHLDGLMDTADAFFSHRDRPQMLAIMRDSRAGALGVAAGVVLLLTKFAAYAHLAGAQHWRIIVVAPILSRLVLVIAAAFFASARESGLGASFAAETRPRHVAGAFVIGAGATAALVGWQAAALVGLCVLIAVVTGMYWQRRLGGLTGDIYGALNEICEVAVLLAAAAMVR